MGRRERESGVRGSVWNEAHSRTSDLGHNQHGSPIAIVINATLLIASLLSNSYCCATLASCKSVGKGACWCCLRSSASEGMVE